MNRPVRCIAALMVILCSELYLPSTGVIASQKMNPLLSLGFSRCYGLPCFSGIIPGKTTWYDAVSILSRQNFRQYVWAISNIDFAGTGITVDRVPDNPDIVNSIELGNLSQKHSIVLDDILELYDVPCKVGTDFRGSFWFAYPNMLVHVLSDSERNSSKAGVIYLNLLNPDLLMSISGITVCEKVEYNREYLLWFTEVF